MKKNEIYPHVSPTKTLCYCQPALSDRSVNYCGHVAWAALCYIPLRRPTTLLICVLIVCDAIMEIWMVCMTPISAAGGPCGPVNQFFDIPSPQFESTKLPFFCGLDWLLKSPSSATQLSTDASQHSPLL